MRIEARGLIYDASHKPDTEKIAIFTSLCPCADGTLLSCFQVGSAKHAPDSRLQLCRSLDGGNRWEELPWRFPTTVAGIPGSLAAGEMVETKPGRLLLLATWFDRSDPQQPLFVPVTEGLVHCKILKTFSADGGRTWAPWEEVDVAGLRGCAGTGPIVRWPDGTLAYPFESYREFDDPDPQPHRAWMLVSRDGGQTFSRPIEVAIDPEHQVYYWDQRLCAADERGGYHALFWTHDLTQKRDLTVHYKRGSIQESSSAGIVPTPIRGQIAAPLRLPDGRLLAFVVDRARPATMKLWVSTDGGKSWPEAHAMVVYHHEERAAVTQGQTNVDFARYWEDMGKWSFGHPAIRLLGNHRVLVAHYAGTPDRMSIHWARIAV